MHGGCTQTIGFQASQFMYFGLLGAAYLVAGVLSAKHYKGSALAFLTLPLAISALKDCNPEVRTIAAAPFLFLVSHGDGKPHGR